MTLVPFFFFVEGFSLLFSLFFIRKEVLSLLFFFANFLSALADLIFSSQNDCFG